MKYHLVNLETNLTIATAKKISELRISMFSLFQTKGYVLFGVDIVTLQGNKHRYENWSWDEEVQDFKPVFFRSGAIA